MQPFLLILISSSLAPPGLVRVADETLDLVVFEGTAPAIGAAMGATREGLDVGLVSRSDHLGGSFRADRAESRRIFQSLSLKLQQPRCINIPLATS